MLWLSGFDQSAKRPPIWFNAVSSLAFLKAKGQECSFQVPDYSVDLEVGLTQSRNGAYVSSMVEEEVNL